MYHLVGGAALCGASLLLEKGNRAFYGNGFIALLYLAIAGSMLSTNITTFLMGEWDIAKVTAYRFISPVLSLVVGMFFWKERLKSHEIIGAVLIVIGVIWINRENAQQGT